MRGQPQVSSKQTAQTQKRLDELSKRRPEVHPAVTMCTGCVQEAGLKGLKMDQATQNQQQTLKLQAHSTIGANYYASIICDHQG